MYIIYSGTVYNGNIYKLLSLSHPDLTVPSRFRGTIAYVIIN